jgi:hypothetical protein
MHAQDGTAGVTSEKTPCQRGAEAPHPAHRSVGPSPRGVLRGGPGRSGNGCVETKPRLYALRRFPDTSSWSFIK